MIEHLKTFGKTHLFYIVLIAVGLVAFRCWLAEHDNRLQAEAIVKQGQVKNADLQQQIDTINKAVPAKVQVITKIVHDAQTPTQVVQAVPLLTNVPLNARVTPDNPAQVSVDALPLAQVLGQARQDAINLTACQQTSVLKDEQLATDKDTIKALQKKPGFWQRIKTKGIDGVVGYMLIEGVKIALTHKL
jgi:hypothetical protein